MKSISWYINRLSKMPPAEVFYRLQNKVKEKWDERFFSKQCLNIPSIEGLKLSRIYGLSKHISSVDVSFFTADNQRLSVLINSADQYCQNKTYVFGKFYEMGDDIDWHLEPKANKRWPNKVGSKLDIRDGFTYGAPKFVWEVNRLYGLPALGVAFKTTKKKKYADKIFQLIESWIKANPYPYGINWTSGIEIGVRVANLIWALSFCKDYELSAQNKAVLNSFFYSHARHLFRYPSKYSSNNNHAIAEAFGLFLIGVFFPFYKESDQWLQYSKSVLEQECLRQILPDGGSYEYSTSYLSFVFDFFLLFKVICDRQSISYNRQLDQRLEKSCEYIFTLMDCKGNIPNIGDQDSAVLVNFGLDNHENLQSILNTGYVLFGNEDFKRDNFPDIKTRMLLGDRIEGLTGAVRTLKNQTKLLIDSGLGVIQGMVKETEVLFVGNATPLGMPPLYPHGHLDALSIYLSVDGKEILIDPGTYLYHSGGKWRRYFRSTAAHNTVRINGRDMTEQVSDFMFGTPYSITEHSMQQDGNRISWRAGHDAYQKLPAQVSHTRIADLNLSSGVVDIKDVLKGARTFHVEQFFHFHPQCNVELDGNKAKVISGDVAVHFVFDAAVQIEAFKGSEDSLLGWFSSRFNHIEPCWTIRGQFECKGKQQELVTNIIL